mmetsp:Transcript_253/g.639  ORF Transcript_253/g.639 Transcript_253/m.639 type:complete len:268 (+) Transcript_253:218-1021(+)
MLHRHRCLREDEPADRRHVPDLADTRRLDLQHLGPNPPLGRTLCGGPDAPSAAGFCGRPGAHAVVAYNLLSSGALADSFQPSYLRHSDLLQAGYLRQPLGPVPDSGQPEADRRRVLALPCALLSAPGLGHHGHCREHQYSGGGEALDIDNHYNAHHHCPGLRPDHCNAPLCLSARGRPYHFPPAGMGLPGDLEQIGHDASCGRGVHASAPGAKREEPVRMGRGGLEWLQACRPLPQHLVPLPVDHLRSPPAHGGYALWREEEGIDHG